MCELAAWWGLGVSAENGQWWKGGLVPLAAPSSLCMRVPTGPPQGLGSTQHLTLVGAYLAANLELVQTAHREEEFQPGHP